MLEVVKESSFGIACKGGSELGKGVLNWRKD